MLMAASLHGRMNVVILLLDRRATVNQQDANGDTALLHAARRKMCGYGSHDGRERCIRYLLNHGGDPDIPNRQGISASTYINPTCAAGTFGAPRRIAPMLSMVSITPAYRAAPSLRRVAPEPPPSSRPPSMPSPAAAWPPNLPARFLDRGSLRAPPSRPVHLMAGF